ncbi:MAG: radical SAM family heme chaperone HemW, partial [Clostridia bacterium]|nr:radical SAM family heme chaperone HemW [Clostridia bacterium]
MTTDASVYIHIPFCIKKCRYCSFYSLESVNEERKQKYRDALIDQLRSFGNEFGTLRLDTLYLGGGTPPSIGAGNLRDIIRNAALYFAFNDDAEITVEINPLSVTENDIAMLKDCGVNRFSIGLQSSDDAMLKKLGRIHTVSDFLKTYEVCRKYSDSVSVDLMFALPDQDMEMLRKDVDFVCGICPGHISLYCLTLDSSVDLYRHKNEYSFADDDKQADMYMYICESLEKNGYDHYEVSNFALKGRESRHNSKCWERYEYIGFGASAHSFFKNRRYA